MTRPAICLFAHDLVTPSPTGLHRYVDELSAGLAGLDADADYFLSSTAQRGTLRPSLALPVRIVRGHRRLLHLSWDLFGAPAVDRLGVRADLVHALYPAVVVPTTAALVVTIADLLPIQHPDWYARHERWSFERAMQYARRHAAAVITISERTAADAVALAGFSRDDITAVPLGVDERFWRPVSDDDKRRVLQKYGLLDRRFALFVGGLDERKNVHTLVRAFAKAAGQLPPDTTLVLAGRPGSGSSLIDDAIRQSGQASRIAVTGFVSDEDLPALLQGALALVHPSTYEGFGFTPLEAMAGGTPTIVASAGSVPEVVGDAALQVDPLDVEGWAAAMVRLIDDADLRTSLAAAGSVRAAGYTWDRTARETHAVHMRVLGA